MSPKIKANSKRILITVILTLMLANSRFFSTPSPLAIGLCTLAPISLLLPIILAYSGYFLLFALDGYNACMLLTAVAAAVIRLRFKKLSTNALISIATGILSGSLVIAGIFLKLSVASWLTTAVLLFGLTYLSTAKPTEGQSIDISLTVKYIVAVVSLSSLPIPIIDIGRIAATVTILHLARLSDVGKSAILSTITAGALLMSSPESIYSALFICTAGLLLPLVSRKSLIRQPLYLICTALLYAFINLRISDDLYFAVDIFIGAAVFLLTFELFENRAFRLLSQMLFRPVLSITPTSSATAVTNALNKIKESVKDSACFIKIPTPPLNSTVAYSRVCLTCAKQSSCISDKSNDLTALDSNKPIENCIHDREVHEAIGNAHDRYDYLCDRSTSCRQTTKSIINLIDLANNVVRESAAQRPVNKALSEELSRRLSTNLSGQVTATVFGDYSCEVSVDSASFLSPDRVTSAITKLTGKKYVSPISVKQNNFTHMFAYPKPKYRTSVTTAAKTACKSIASGDVFTQLSVGNMAYFILSDGMGTGTQAKESAKHLLETVVTLLKSGLSVETSVRVASAVTKNTNIDESFATLDIFELNLNTAECNIYKAGAADSYILSDEPKTVKSGGYPIGIFDKVFISHESFSLGVSDEIILATDGAELTSEKIASALAKSENEADIPELLINSNVDADRENDDSFIAVIKILQNI